MRLRSLDLLRGLGIAAMLFLHAALYHYGRLFELDPDRVPLVVMLIGFLLMWAPLFAIISGVAHTVRSFERAARGATPMTLLRWNFTAGALTVLLGVVYFALFGPSLLDFAGKARDSSLLVGLLRGDGFSLPSPARLLYMNTLHMIGFSLLLAAPIVTWLACATHQGGAAARRGVAIAALLVFAASWFRIPLFPMFEQAMAEQHYGLALALTWLVNKHDPVLPALGFFLLGAMVGGLACTPACGTRWRAPTALAIALLATGAVGWAFGPDTMLKRGVDWSWLAISLLQAGVLLLGVSIACRWLDSPPPPPAHGPAGGHAVAPAPAVAPVAAVARAGAGARATGGALARTLERFGQHGLSVLFGEALLAESAGRLLGALLPGWNDTIGATLCFAASMVLVWAVLLRIWERRGYRYSIEHGWAWLARRLGRPSSRTEPFARPP